MNQFKGLLWMLGFVLFSVSAIAQGPPPPENKEMREKMEKLKIAFISESLNLTVAEAKLFWPIYNEKEDAIRELREDMHANHRKIKKGEINSEKELLELLSESTANRAMEAQVMEKYVKDCLPILGLDRSIQLLEMDHEFKKRIKEKLENLEKR